MMKFEERKTMEVLDLITESVQEIIDLTFSNYTGKMTYFLNVDCVIQEFSSKIKLVNFMNKNGWVINTVRKS